MMQAHDPTQPGTIFASYDQANSFWVFVVKGCPHHTGKDTRDERHFILSQAERCAVKVIARAATKPPLVRGGPGR